ncbi:MAG: hypothetical protein P4L87_06555, partial [Formivibrio sp.]|nr:hypothetical protein [Formivibrio sp.]
CVCVAPWLCADCGVAVWLCVFWLCQCGCVTCLGLIQCVCACQSCADAWETRAEALSVSGRVEKAATAAAAAASIRRALSGTPQSGNVLLHKPSGGVPIGTLAS